MSEIPDTRDSLLVRVRDRHDRDAWDQFAAIYRPVVYRLARTRGMQDADAQDLTQKVLVSIAGAIGDWERTDQNTRFRHWLRKVAKHAVLNALSRKPKDLAGGGTTATMQLHQHQDDVNSCEAELDLEYRRQLYRRAAEIVRSRADETTWLAFSMTMVDGATIADTAQSLNKSEGVIYAARSRIMKRLRDAIRELEDQ